ncbi:MAG: M20/M25/M40 family metallo-hydrolase [Candidatus Aminicenantes bacterium]|nr:M20/M25/M40 family metallo-hydrolase [Candidatus Aminicenantes bacterium]
MNRTRLASAVVLIFLVGSLAAHAQVRPADTADTAMLNRIWLEGTGHSRVMEHLSWITDVFGPRIPGSPAYDKAAAWAVKRFTELGLANAVVEPVGELGLGWSCEYVSAHMTAPSYMPILAYPRPWTGSTKGRITGSPVVALLSSKADLEKYKGKLKGAIVLLKEPRPVHPSFSAPASRLDDKGLREIEETPIPVKPAGPGGPGGEGGLKWEELEEFFKTEEVGCLIEPLSGNRADFGTVRVDAYEGNGKDFTTRGQSPRIFIAAEQYNRICRVLDLKVPVTLEIEVRTAIYDKDTKGYDVTAEIPGTDKKDELVMLGGHLDSWTGGTGAVDDAAGCAVAMEAVRILKALGVKPRRTIRAAFWTGEEEGFYGSRGYVARHFGDTDKQSLDKLNFEELEKNWRNPLGDSTKLLAKPDYAKISGYFNYDNGSGRIRGIYLQENFQVRPIFEAWMKPLKDLGVTAIALQNTEGTDHLPFDYIGIPGFQFIQDPLDYFPGLHHTNQDVYDHAVPEDLIQSAVVMAYFVYQTAMRDERLPRKTLPIPVEMPGRTK